MKNSYEFLTSVIGEVKGKISDALVVRVYANDKKEALNKAKKIAETEHCWLRSIDECFTDIGETKKSQKAIISLQKQMFDWMKKKT